MIGRMRRDERGFAIMTILVITGIASAVIVGGSKTAASIYDRELTIESTRHMRQVAGAIRDKAGEVGGEAGRLLQQRARQFTRVADGLDDRATEQVVADIADNLGDALFIPLQGAGGLVGAAEWAWDKRGHLQLANTAWDAYQPIDPTAIDGMEELQALVPLERRDTPVEQAIAEAKVRGLRNAAELAGFEAEEVDPILVEALIGVAEDDFEPELVGEFDNPFWREITDGLGLPPEMVFPFDGEAPVPTTSTTTTTTTEPEGIVEAMRLTWSYQELSDGHDVVTFSIENISDQRIENIKFWNLDNIPDENWTPGPPPWTLEPGEVLEGVAKFRISVYGMASWDVAEGNFPDSIFNEVYSNGVNTLTGEDYPWEEHLL